jgi:hypothetical protein
MPPLLLATKLLLMLLLCIKLGIAVEGLAINQIDLSTTFTYLATSRDVAHIVDESSMFIAATSAASAKDASPEDARVQFFLWFFGGSGAAGIARSAFPRMYEEVRRVQSLKGQGPTLGGQMMGISPLVGYPQDLSVADVKAVVSNPMTVEEMVRNYPVEGNFLASKYGYLTFQAFSDANKNKNPLAVRAVFDTFATSTDVVEPDKAQAFLDEYKNDIRSINSKLLRSKLVGYSSIITLLFLLGYADAIAFGHLYNGWFPDWPGGKNFPASLLDDDGALWKIPQYWI